MTNITKSQIQKISFLNECLKSSKSEKIVMGVIGSIKSYSPKMIFSWKYIFENSKLKNPLE